MDYVTRHGICVKHFESSVDVCNFLEEQMFNIRVISVVYNSTEEVYEVFYKE